jgi:hypothetical protein
MATLAARATLPLHMDAMEREAAPLRCAGCGGVIGVYEPIVHVVGGIANKTSRAAEPALRHAEPGSLFHLACSDLEPTAVVAVD